MPMLDHPEPFAATLGVMLYPAMDKADPPKAPLPRSGWESHFVSFAMQTTG
jgi:hypothetical protein